jgi:hypothetical protein
MSYLPAKEADFVERSGNLIAVSSAHTSEWNLPEDKVAELQTPHNDLKALHERCQTASYTKLDMQAKNEKKSQFIRLEEVFVRNNLQNNEVMTDDDRKALRIPIHDTTPTPHPAPDTIPELEVATPHPRTVRIKFRDEHRARWGKHQYVHGLECLWLIADAPPAQVKDLLHSEFATRSPLELVFEEDEQGKGLWSDIYSAVIP